MHTLYLPQGSEPEATAPSGHLQSTFGRRTASLTHLGTWCLRAGGEVTNWSYLHIYFPGQTAPHAPLALETPGARI